VRERARILLPAELPTAALLRDIGLLVLAGFLEGPDRVVFGIARESGYSLPECERMVLDATHGEVGAVLCQAWRFSDSIRIGVQHHHDPDACDEPIALGLYLADAIASKISERAARPWSHSQIAPDFLAAAMETLGIPAAKFDTLVEDTIVRFQSRDTGLVLELRSPEEPPAGTTSPAG
jgi:HD-like signal output (HDOD) protein